MEKHTVSTEYLADLVRNFYDRWFGYDNYPKLKDPRSADVQKIVNATLIEAEEDIQEMEKEYPGCGECVNPDLYGKYLLAEPCDDPYVEEGDRYIHQDFGCILFEALGA
ncbi:MAG: hypothetical protein IMZ71_04715 [Chloroflexi bacterium]|nr:hypothetical protein [Chloroflexota bacterium]